MSALEQSINEVPNLVLSGHILNRQLQTIQVDNQFIRLRSKLWQVLEHLVENRNNLVSRQSLIELSWNGNSYTGEQGLTHTVCHLRRILSKYGIDAKITTIPKRGYVLQEASESFERESMMQFVQYSREPKSNESANSNLLSMSKIG